MANWEYKVISSGKGGFASPALMEKFINDLGKESWEIINFHTAPDNPLAFTGLARRSVERDWTLEDAAAAAARAETEKLRAEFEAKFKAATSGATAAPTEEKAPDFLEEKAAGDDGLRRPRDTSRDDDPDAPEDDQAPKDEWDKISAEDELPSFFDALKPHMRRNQRGPGMFVGTDYLAKKWKLEESDIKTALVECGLQIPADENAKPVYVEYDGDLYWVNINRRGEIWINTREKPQPVFRVVAGKRLTDEEVPAEMAAAEPRDEPRRDDRRDDRPRQPQQSQPREAQPPREENNAPKTFLDKLRGMMRRNRHGHGWSGSFPYLTKALHLDEAQLLEQLAGFGLKLAGEGEPQARATDNGFTYWLNRNQRGEIWINAGRERTDDRGQKSEAGNQGADAHAPAAEMPAATLTEPAPLPPENILTAVRLLMQPKKRGEGVTAPLTEVSAKLEKTDEQVMALLASAGLQLPETPKGKPTFAEHGGEIYWLNANAKGQVWLNAKQSAATKKTKGKKAAESEESGE